MNEKMIEVIVDFTNSAVQKLVDNPEEVKVTSFTSTKTVVIEIDANKKDFGKIIGKKGKTIESLKTLASAIKKTNYPDDLRNVSLEILGN